jgi:peroxiredoxin-like protein
VIRARQESIMSEHQFTVRASWHGSSQTGAGQLNSKALSSTFSIPGNLGGPGQGTNPEELVVSAAASCYLITLAVALDKRGVPFDKLEVTTDGMVLFDKGLQLTRLTHHPRITLIATATVAHREAALATAEQAEQGCMLSRAVRGNVPVNVHPLVVSSGTEEHAGEEHTGSRTRTLQARSKPSA